MRANQSRKTRFLKSNLNSSQFPTAVNRDKVRKVLDSETDLAEARRTHFERACHAFEQQHQMTSEEFMRLFESGALGDDAEYFDWYTAKRGLDLWERRFRILSGVRV